MTTEAEFTPAVHLPALGAAVTYYIQPTEICDPVTDALLRYDDTHAGVFGAVVTGAVPTNYRSACACCGGHWHVVVLTVKGDEYVDCPADLTVVDPSGLPTDIATHGTPVHTATPSADSPCYLCRDDYDRASYATTGRPDNIPF
jgi:hypothetical protein